ncbi:MAG: response regulator receiver protein [Symbiobacteriaceae bacterium]|jgi:DNA-binding response OmpR family regulator|nr:response regulator receiver protein [Symbiobacteriaceae bacterium]
MPKVLIVEDDPQIARIVQIKLTNNGFTVIHAPDGGAGLAAVREHRPDLVLLDVMMPVMDGYQVLRSLRAEPEFAKLPVIMLTAKGQERDILHGFKDGATDYVVKPFSPAEVVARVQRALR